MELNKLMTFIAANCGIDQLICYIADLKLLKSSYQEAGVELPEWVETQLATAKAQVKISVDAAKRAALKKLQARRSALATPQEQRQSIDEQIAQLEKQLA